MKAKRSFLDFHDKYDGKIGQPSESKFVLMNNLIKPHQGKAMVNENTLIKGKTMGTDGKYIVTSSSHPYLNFR